MKQLFGTIGKILFWIFAVALFFWTASLSLAALRTILPGDPIKPYVGLVLTDIGALTWLLVFIGQAEGLPQRAISLIMFIVDLAGVVLLSAYELLTSGQTLAAVPAEMGNGVIWGVIGLTLINLAAAYFYHLVHPHTWKQIQFGVLTDRLQKEALDQAQASVEAEAQKLGAILAARATADLKYQLRLPMSDFESAEHTKNLPASKQVIDAKAQPAGLPWWKRGKKQPAPVNVPGAAAMATYPQDVPQILEKPTPIPEDVKAMYAPGTRFTDGTSNPPAKAGKYIVYDKWGQALGELNANSLVNATAIAEATYGKGNVASVKFEEDQPSAGPFPS